MFAWDMKKMVLSAIEAEEDENERLIQLDSGGLGVLGVFNAKLSVFPSMCGR